MATVVLLALLAPTAAGSAPAATRFTAAPHFLVLDDRERIVLFADGPLAGAVAEQRPDGGIDVTVPGVTVDASLAGRSFDDHPAGGGGATRVRVTQSPGGYATIRVERGAPIGRVHAFAASKPSRLTIDLLRPAAKAAAQRTKHPREAGAAAAPPPRPRVAAAQNVPAPEPTPSANVKEPAAATALPAGPTPVARKAAKGEVASASSAAASPVATDLPALAAASPAAAAPVGPPAPDDRARLACRWRRVAGIAYCAPDPATPAYAVDLGAARLAGKLDRGRGGPTIEPLPEHGPVEAFLNADVALVRRASGGWLLPVVALYERALRTYPDFVDAARARANLVLAYHAIGFAPELDRLARDENDPVAPFAAALLADLRREDGDERDVDALLARASAAGGFAACLAARVRASLAADRARESGDGPGAAASALAGLASVCPRTIVEDPATSWLRGRVLTMDGQARRAATLLAPLEGELPARERPWLLADLARAYQAAGDATSARRVEERLASGAFGPRAQRLAQVALAKRDATEGHPGDVGRRLAALPPGDARHGREEADLASASELLRAGDEIAALGLLSERKLDPRRLPPSDQIQLARALRRVGLLAEAERLVQGLRVVAPGRLPDAFFAELGAQALARSDAAAALAAADEWTDARAGDAPPGALALRARAQAAKGDARGASDLVTKQLMPRDAALGREVAVEIAQQVRSADPALALQLAREALDAQVAEPLPAAQHALALRTVAETAEATGDARRAQEAFATLAREHADDPAAAGAAYRAARLDATPTPGASTQAVAAGPAVTPPAEDDALSRRVAAAGRLYAEVVDLARAGEKR